MRISVEEKHEKMEPNEHKKENYTKGVKYNYFYPCEEQLIDQDHIALHRLEERK